MRDDQTQRAFIGLAEVHKRSLQCGGSLLLKDERIKEIEEILDQMTDDLVNGKVAWWISNLVTFLELSLDRMRKTPLLYKDKIDKVNEKLDSVIDRMISIAKTARP